MLHARGAARTGVIRVCATAAYAAPPTSQRESAVTALISRTFADIPVGASLTHTHVVTRDEV